MSTQYSTDQGSKSSQEAQREVQQSRAEVEDTLEAIQERLSPGQVFRLVTRDEGAPVDVPAWCRLTGHVMLDASHPVYYLARGKD